MNSYILKTSVRKISKNSRNKDTIGIRKIGMIQNNRNKNSNKIIVATLRTCSTNGTNNNKRDNTMMKVIATQTTANKTEYLLLLLLLTYYYSVNDLNSCIQKVQKVKQEYRRFWNEGYYGSIQ